MTICTKFAVITGIIFTAGCNDRLVNAFQPRKTKLEKLGQLEIPNIMGSATCLASNDKTLFVGTKKNAILSAELFSKSSYNDLTLSNPPNLSRIYGRSVSSGALLAKPFSRSSKRQIEESQEKNPSIFSSWDDDEIARGFEDGLVCVSPMNQLTLKQRTNPTGSYF